MPRTWRCPTGTTRQYRYKNKVRLGGCARKGRFVKVKEIKTTKRGRTTYSYPK